MDNDMGRLHDHLEVDYDELIAGELHDIMCNFECDEKKALEIWQSLQKYDSYTHEDDCCIPF